MTLAIVNTSATIAADNVNNVFSSQDSANSPTWRVANLVAGTLVNLGTGTNTSDVNYNPFTKRFGFIRNNFAAYTEISESDIVNSVASPTLIRVVTLNGMFGDDSEGLSDVVPNFSEGGYEFWSCIENGGRVQAYNFQISEGDMFSTSPITITARQELTVAPTQTDNNSGAEGVDMHLWEQKLIVVQEGQQVNTPQAIYEMDRPVDRFTDYDAAVDAQLIVAEPWDAAAQTGDLSSCVYHAASDTILILSDTGNAVYQYDRTGTLLSTFTIVGMGQPEGICFHGDNLIIMGEADECMYCTYVVA